MSEEKPGVRAGNYAHYKGGAYTALGLVEHHETHAPYVLYISHTMGKLKIRPLKPVPGDPDAWDDWVGGEGKRMRRFAYLGDKPPVVESRLAADGVLLIKETDVQAKSLLPALALLMERMGDRKLSIVVTTTDPLSSVVGPDDA